MPAGVFSTMGRRRARACSAEPLGATSGLTDGAKKARPPMPACVFIPLGSPVARGSLGIPRWFVATILTITALLTTSRVEAGPLFDASFLSFDVGYHPTSVAVGDLDGDGTPDL